MEKNILSYLAGLGILIGGYTAASAQENLLLPNAAQYGSSVTEKGPHLRNYGDVSSIPLVGEVYGDSQEVADLLAEAERLYQSKRYNDAEKLYLQYVQSKPASQVSFEISKAWHRLANIAKMRQQIDKAQIYLTNAIKSDPSKDPKITFDYAVILYDLGEYERAKNFFTYLVQKAPEIQEAQLYLGKTLLAIEPSADLLPFLEKEYGREEAGRILADRCREVGKEEDAKQIEKMIFAEKIRGDQIFFAADSASGYQGDNAAVLAAEPAENITDSFASAVVSAPAAAPAPAAEFAGNFSDYAPRSAAPVESVSEPESRVRVEPGTDSFEESDEPESFSVAMKREAPSFPNENNLSSSAGSQYPQTSFPSMENQVFSVQKEAVSEMLDENTPSLESEINTALSNTLVSNGILPENSEIEAASVSEREQNVSAGILNTAPIPAAADLQDDSDIPAAYYAPVKVSKPIVFSGLSMSADEGEPVSSSDSTGLADFDMEETYVQADIPVMEDASSDTESMSGFDGYQIPASAGLNPKMSDTSSLPACSETLSVSRKEDFGVSSLPQEKEPIQRVAMDIPEKESAEMEFKPVLGSRKYTSEEKLEMARRAGAKITYLTPEEYRDEIATRAGKIVREAEDQIIKSDSLNEGQKRELLNKIHNL